MDPDHAPASDFVRSLPQMYDRHLVPLIFQSYAVEVASRVATLEPRLLLEVAAGTGAVTRELASRLADTAQIVATDLSQPMLDHAASVGFAGAVDWRQADAMALPFDDHSFDTVVCQFGVMFFPDRPRAFAEMRRVLRPGGRLIFTTWDIIQNNDFAHTVLEAVGTLFPDDRPTFLARVPYGYFDIESMKADLAAGGFTSSAAVFDTVDFRSRAATCEVPARAFCLGTPLRDEIEARDPTRLVEATSVAASAIEQRFGARDVDGRIRAHVVVTEES